MSLHSLRASAIALMLAVLNAGAANGIAQDKIVLQKAGATSRITLPCSILDYTGKSITVRLKTGTGQKTYSASEVVEVITPQTAAHERGLQLYAQDAITEATTQFESALKQEPRLWVRRELLALLIRCSSRQLDYASAGTRFLLLTKSDPVTRHYRLIPLTWVHDAAATNSSSQAKAWLVGSLELERLLGASLLLHDSGYGELAETELKRLQSSTDGRIRQLAHAQLWRQRLIAGDLTSMELVRWGSRIREMPSDLRGGPYFLLGRGHWLRQEYEQAAAAWLWLPLVYDTDFHLAARACCNAADALLRVGQSREATTLYQETAFRFDDSGFASEANTQLRLLAEPQQ